MHYKDKDWRRRVLLKTFAGIALGSTAGAGGATPKQGESGKPLPTETAASAALLGKPGEFDFLAGEWQIKHRRLKKAGGADWDEFAGEATCWTILGGVGSIEELRIPERDFFGLGIRLLDLQTNIWSDYWANKRNAVLSGPGLTGGFRDGVGTFTADDKDGDKPIRVRGVWDQITKTSCRWRQGVSYDGGNTWSENWFMDWRRR